VLRRIRSRSELGAADGVAEEADRPQRQPESCCPCVGDETVGSDAGDVEDPKLELVRSEASVVAHMLEAGIIFHSMFIGITLGVSGSPGVVRPLMIALMFHQVRAAFGAALGSWSALANL
jgi:solute carrier family 39 (zinc transporter), member 1/2/3